MRLSLCLVLTIAALFALDVPLAEAQKALELRGPPSCQSCEITLSHELSLGGEEAPGIGPYFNIARDSRGRWLVTTAMIGSEFGVFDPSGQPIRTIGRSGQGPGEFFALRQMIPSGDTISMFDIAARRETVFDSDFNVVRTNILPSDFNSVLFLDDSTRIFNFVVHTEDKVGFPLHVVDLEGRITRSFGDEGLVYRRDFPLASWRALSASGVGGFWAAKYSEYVLDRWNPDGRQEERIVREAQWFEPYYRESLVSESTPPPPALTAVSEDSEGLLWVAIAVADPDWREGLGRASNGELNVISYEDFYDTILEVLDPRKETVLASQRFDPFLQHFIGDSLIASYQDDDQGLPFVDVWKLHFIHPGRD